VAPRLQTPRGQAGLIIACAAWLDGSGKYREETEDLGIDAAAEQWLEVTASRLAQRFIRESRRDWYWCEDIMTYDNAMLPYALLRAAGPTGQDQYGEVGLKALDFLSQVTYRTGHFTPIGNQGWYPRGGEPALFDQQALEAGSMVLAC